MIANSAHGATTTRRAGGLPIDWLFAAPAALAAAFLGVPLLALVWRALASGEMDDSLSSGMVLDALWLSMFTSTVTLLIALIAGTPLAYLLARRNFRGKTAVDVLVDLPIVLPPTVAGVALLVTLGRRGVIGEELDAAGVNIAFTTAAVILAQTFVSAPFYIRTAKAGFEGVPAGYEGVASTLGASEFRSFWRVTFPLARPSIIAGAILCWARALSELGATLIFAGNMRGETQTMPLAIISAFESGKPLEVAIAISVILLLAAAVMLALLRILARGARA